MDDLAARRTRSVGAALFIGVLAVAVVLFVRCVMPTSAAWQNNAAAVASGSVGTWGPTPTPTQAADFCAVPDHTACGVQTIQVNAQNVSATDYTVGIQMTANFSGSQVYEITLDLDTVLRSISYNGGTIDLIRQTNKYPSNIQLQDNGQTVYIYGCGTRYITLVPAVARSGGNNINGSLSTIGSSSSCRSGAAPTI